jgi:hypothetical protein
MVGRMISQLEARLDHCDTPNRQILNESIAQL